MNTDTADDDVTFNEEIVTTSFTVTSSSSNTAELDVNTGCLQNTLAKIEKTSEVVFRSYQRVFLYHKPLKFKIFTYRKRGLL